MPEPTEPSESPEPIVTEVADNAETTPVEQEPSVGEKVDDTTDALKSSAKNPRPEQDKR